MLSNRKGFVVKEEPLTIKSVNMLKNCEIDGREKRGYDGNFWEAPLL
jgi:hypothetical protein